VGTWWSGWSAINSGCVSGTEVPIRRRQNKRSSPSTNLENIDEPSLKPSAVSKLCFRLASGFQSLQENLNVHHRRNMSAVAFVSMCLIFTSLFVIIVFEEGYVFCGAQMWIAAGMIDNFF
jgi:hypothetical protein